MRWRALLVDARHVDRPVRAKNARLDAGARLANRYTPQGFWREALFQSASREKILSRATPGVTEPEIKRLRRGDMRLRGIDGRDSRLPSKAKFPPQRNQTVDSRFTASLVIVNIIQARVCWQYTCVTFVFDVRASFIREGSPTLLLLYCSFAGAELARASSRTTLGSSSPVRGAYATRSVTFEKSTRKSSGSVSNVTPDFLTASRMA